MPVGTRIYVGRLSYQVRERDLERFFKGHGRMREVLLKNGFGFVEFEDYRDADDAVYELNGKELCGERVIVEHARGGPRGNDHGRDRDRGGYAPPPRYGRDNHGTSGTDAGAGSGRQRRNQQARYGPPTRTENRIIIENLSSRVSWQDLKDYMRQAGEVTYADAHKQKKNEGIVEFATYGDMKNALDKLDDTEINGRRIRLIEDKPRRSRRSRSHSRSRSRSRSRRSRSRSSRSRSSRSRSRSRSHGRSKSRSHSRSKSRSHSRSRSRSRSRSHNKSKSRSKSKSVSPSPRDVNGVDSDKD